MANNYDEIEKAIGSLDLGVDEEADDYEGVKELTGTNMVAILQERVNTVMNENMKLHRRLASVEAKVQAMYAHFTKAPERSKVDFGDENRIRDRYVSMNQTLGQDNNADEMSFTELDPNESVSVVSAASPSPAPAHPHDHVRDEVRDHAPTPTSSARARRINVPSPTNINPFSNYFESVRRTESMFKSNSATAPQGYVNKGSVWGVALASMLTAAMRYYISKKDARMLMIDQPKMVAVYHKIVPVLYESYATKELPGVSDPLTFRLSQAISRKEKNEIPDSYAKDWMDLENTQEGKDIMAVIRIIITAAKAVPEAMVHPVSQLVPYMHKHPVVDGPAGPIFAILPSVNVNPAPGPWESWCLVLKTEALVKYVRYRLSDMTPTETITRMSSEMKPGELAEKKNWNKLMTFNPAAMIGSAS